ncbi:hypothetical protein [Alicyclobacillus fodiniaquatilis]|uniref:YjcQ protein n=1 Tax=Alicyclobacillus fodiniaquatilis TaxID=1661150 RepID=A0ABW4JI74_9BACL
MSEHTEQDLLLFLVLVKNNGNLENLVSRGYQYSQIGEMISYCIQKNVIRLVGDKLEITDVGMDNIESMSKAEGVSHNQILPQKEYFLEQQLKKYDIFVPENFV